MNMDDEPTSNKEQDGTLRKTKKRGKRSKMTFTFEILKVSPEEEARIDMLIYDIFEKYRDVDSVGLSSDED